MGVLKKFLQDTKIEPIIESKAVHNKKIIGFRGVRDNLGTTTLLTHVALNLAAKGMLVCVVDMDFNTPNPILSTRKTYSILSKWSNSRENINSIINKTDLHPNISYVGPDITCSIMDFLPLKVDKAYLLQKQEVVLKIFEELSEKFDIILVDIPPDIRQVEVFYPLMYCDEVFTLTQYDYPSLNKLQKDYATCVGLVDDKKMTTLIHVNTIIPTLESYCDVNKDFVILTKIAHSADIAEKSLRKIIQNPTDVNNVSGVDEFIYFAGIKCIVDYLLGEKVGS